MLQSLSNRWMQSRSEQRRGYKNFFKNQCTVLEEQLLIATEILSRGNGPQSALKDLRRLLTIGRTLTDACRREPCQKAYLRQADRTQAITETFQEIIWCMSLVFFHNSKALNFSPGIPSEALESESLPEAKLGAREQYKLLKATLDDRYELHSALCLWIENHQICSVQECGVDRGVGVDPLCLAAQIKERTRNNARNADVEVPPAQADHTSVLWAIQQKVLKDRILIGSGAYGNVYEVTWLGDKYAMKEFGMHNSQRILEVEANTLAKLNHPHIIKPLAFSVSGSECILLMDLMPHDLRAYMQKRVEKNNNPPFLMLGAIDLMFQIAEACRYINSQGMVHRDLKPQNILVQPVDAPELAEEGFVIAKLADFGLAKSKREVSAYSHQTKETGTKLWMAPELFKANVDDDEHKLPIAYCWKADVYSFGIVCSEILTGNPPYHGVPFQRAELYEKLKDPTFRPVLPATCPASLASLIFRCWDFNPERRPDFSEISSTLRCLKGLLLTESTPEVSKVSMTLRHIKGLRNMTDDEQLSKIQTALQTLQTSSLHTLPISRVHTSFATNMVKLNGLYGHTRRDGTKTNFYDGLSNGITSIKIYLWNDSSSGQVQEKIAGFKACHQLNGVDYEVWDSHGGDHGLKQWVHFKYPDEYLVQVKGSTTEQELSKKRKGQCVTSLTFITNEKTYGPIGFVNSGTEFSTDSGRVVGFCGFSGNFIESLGIFTVPT